jgi:hypothetical protein
LARESCDEHRQLLNALNRYCCGQGGDEVPGRLPCAVRLCRAVCSWAHGRSGR